MPFVGQGLPQLHDLQRRKAICFLEVRGGQQQVGDGVRHQVAADGKEALSKVSTTPVFFQHLLQLPLQVIVHISHALHEALRISRRKELRMAQDVPAKAAHIANLLFRQSAAARIGSQPTLQQLAHSGPGVVLVGPPPAGPEVAKGFEDTRSPGALVLVDDIQRGDQVRLFPALKTSLRGSLTGAELPQSRVLDVLVDNDLQRVLLLRGELRLAQRQGRRH
mmetsp:Transcript_51170/g.122564  ORF Transcript_51170/g.122564 Transcript_51170/m.122564 type:complete len:221 (-) Transcript_51170:115-777(-)